VVRFIWFSRGDIEAGENTPLPGKNFVEAVAKRYMPISVK
jgi:hypothetical protein